MPKRSSSEEFPVLDDSDVEKQEAKRLKLQEKEYRDKLLRSSETLTTVFSRWIGMDIFDPNSSAPFHAPSWMQVLSLDDLFQLLNHSERIKIVDDDSEAELVNKLRGETENDDDDDAFEQAYALEFPELARLSVLSTFFYLIMMKTEKFNFWNRLINARAPKRENGKQLKPKFRFLNTVNKWRIRSMPEMRLEPLMAFLNWSGLDYCAKCPMQTMTLCESSGGCGDVVPLSVYRIETPEEASEKVAVRTDNFGKHTGAPLWFRNAAQMLAKVPCRYRCISCSSVLDTEVCGVPLACVFYACEKQTSKKHAWTKLDVEICHPETQKPLAKKYSYCLRCGLLEEKHSKREIECAHCEPDKHGKCTCKPCKLCARSLKACRCIECNECDRCQKHCKPCVERKMCCKCSSSSSESSDSSSDSFTSSSSASDSE
jgi:hypothetical protein